MVAGVEVLGECVCNLCTWTKIDHDIGASLSPSSESIFCHSLNRFSRIVCIGQPVRASHRLISDIISLRCDRSWTQRPACKMSLVKAHEWSKRPTHLHIDTGRIRFGNLHLLIHKRSHRLRPRLLTKFSEEIRAGLHESNTWFLPVLSSMT